MSDPQPAPHPQPEPQPPACRCPFFRPFPSLILGLILGILLGCVIGARYLYYNVGIHGLTGFLPPYERNLAGVAMPPFKQKNEIPPDVLSIGMSKQQVIAKLKLEQVVVLSGDMSDETWRWVSDGHAARPAPDKMIEVWLIPWTKAGLTSFTALCFDDHQKLSSQCGSEFMFGFPTNTFNYAKK